MKVFKKLLSILSIAAIVGMVACEDKLDEINKNPNGVDPASSNPNLMMPGIMSSLGKTYVDLGFGDIAGVVQHTQKDAWNGAHNNYDWDTRDWTGQFDILRNNDFMIRRSEEIDFQAHKGIGLVIQAYTFGLLADLYGDVPYTAALQGYLGGNENLLPAFDSQEDVYMGIIDDLKEAAEILATADASVVNGEYDIYYGGDTEKWQKFANSLLLRYYMRISDKMPDVAKAGIEAIYTSGVYFESTDDDATMSYVGGSTNDSWPSAYDLDNGSSFRRIRMGKPLLDNLLMNNDPRLEVWLDPVHVQWVVDPSLPVAYDEFIRENGVILEGVPSYNDADFVKLIAAGNVYTRHYNPDSTTYDDGMYVGAPIQLPSTGVYNGNPNSAQSLENQHMSQLGSIFRERANDLLKARLMTYAEVSFIFAEAALKGWSVGSAEEWYNNGVEASLESWGVADGFGDYIAQPGVAFDGTLEQLMTQKWIASWTAATESWFDYRRTGFPDFQTGSAGNRDVLPVRFIYGDDELNFNTANANEAIQSLEETSFSNPQGKNSAWSKPWVLQGTNKPW